MEQQIHFCTSPDGVRLAYATVGTGPPLVKAANWLTHLEYDWNSPVWCHWLQELAANHTLIRYDERGCGLSDWNVKDFSLNIWVQDLETVVDTLNLERFPLLGISQGGAVAISYALRHPEKVSHLILYGAYARGWALRNFSAEEIEQQKALSTLIRIGWGKDNPAFRQVFSTLFMPEGTAEQHHWFTDLQRMTTSPENAARFHHAFGEVDVLDLLPKIAVPTLVLHARADGRVPMEAGRELAAMIPRARFVLLDSKNHILLESEPAWQRFVEQVRSFLGVKGGKPASTAAAGPASSPQPPLTRSEAPTDSSKAPLISGWESLKSMVGKEIKHYQILEELGGGGMGLVYKARDRRLDRLVALKILPPYFDRIEELKQRFIREAMAASALDHPNICTIHDIDQTDEGMLFIVMACYEGETLEKKIARGPLAVQEVLNYALQAAEGLSRAHAAGIVHRDIKPANIMVTGYGIIKLLDFGIAKVANATLTNTGTTIGTVAYMSPEQVRGEPVDGRTDLWALGVVMYEMLTGQSPFRGEYNQAVMFSILHEEAAALQTLREDVPQALLQAVERLLRKKPEERFHSAEDLLAALR